MIYRIKKDEQEFRNIVRGLIRKDLLKFLQKGTIRILGQGKGVAIPIEEIEIPRIKFRSFIKPSYAREHPDSGEGSVANSDDDIGIGQGNGAVGDDLGPVADDGDGKPGDGKSGERKAGQGRGDDYDGAENEIIIPNDDWYELFKEVLELPRIKPKGERSIKTQESKYTDIRRSGPESMRVLKRTFLNALKRSLREGIYNPDDPMIIPVNDDKRYRAQQEIFKPRNNAVIFYMMDVSGSVQEEDREIIRFFCALSEFWIKANYDDVEVVWIIHDWEADEVTKEKFFMTQRTGGTLISSAHLLMLDIIAERFPPEKWNIYPMYFSDGANWLDDDSKCVTILREKILPIANQYAYGEVNSFRWWMPDDLRSGQRDPSKKFSPTGSYGAILMDEFAKNEQIVCVNLLNKEGVPEAIREVFKKGQ